MFDYASFGNFEELGTGVNFVSGDHQLRVLCLFFHFSCRPFPWLGACGSGRGWNKPDKGRVKTRSELVHGDEAK